MSHHGDIAETMRDMKRFGIWKSGPAGRFLYTLRLLKVLKL